MKLIYLTLIALDSSGILLHDLFFFLINDLQQKLNIIVEN